MELKTLTPEESARILSDFDKKREARNQEIIDEIAKYVCNACEMGLGFDGECNGAAYEDYKTCGICQETAQKIYDDIFCKYREVLQ